MVVLWVTLLQRVTMRRSTRFSAFFSPFSASLASALGLVAIVSCSSDNLAPKTGPGVDPNSVHLISVPDSVKLAYYASLAASPTMVGNVMLGVPARISATSLASGSCSSSGGAAAYTKARVGFALESDPVNAIPMPSNSDDGYVADMPIGFDFNFYGNTYSKLNLYLNGFVTFGTALNKPYWLTGSIPAATDPYNMIALAWNDWYPGRVPGSLRYETRGTAPNRRFLIQFRGVPEVFGSGKLTSLLVLSEGTNEITIYTTSFTMTYSGHRMTQGIENADGSLAVFDSALTSAGLVTPRVRGWFSLTNDAVRFSPVNTRDVVPPTITAPANITVGNDPGLATAVVAVGSPVATDNCPGVQVSSVRSDGLAIDAPYHVGVTTITWTATDASGNKASAVQTVTVKDIEPPKLTVPADFSVNATSPSGAVVTFALIATDNVGVTSLTCDHNSGSTLPIGYTSITCGASDAAGNTTSKTFGVEVIGAQQQMGDLIQYVLSLGLPNGTTNPLVNQLRAAVRDGSSPQACTKMSDFSSLVGKKGGNILEDDAFYMTTAAKRICNVMGCASGISASISASMSARGFPQF